MRSGATSLAQAAVVLKEACLSSVMAWEQGDWLARAPAHRHWCKGRGVGRRAPRWVRRQVHPLPAAMQGGHSLLRAVLYLGSPSGAGTPSARVSLGVPAFLGFCLVFLSMWTCPGTGRVRGLGDTIGQSPQRHLSPFYRGGRRRSHVIAACGAGAQACHCPAHTL